VRGYTPHQMRMVRRALDAGRGTVLRLDELRGDVLEVKATEHPDGRLPHGVAVFEVWTLGDPDDVVAQVDKYAPAGVLVVPIVRKATARHRWRSWARWRAWRLRFRFAGVLRRFGALAPTFHGRALSRATRGDVDRA